MDHSQQPTLSAIPPYLLPTRAVPQTHLVTVSNMSLEQTNSENDRGSPMSGLRWHLTGRSPITRNNSPNSQSSKGDINSRVMMVEQHDAERALEVMKLGENVATLADDMAAMKKEMAAMKKEMVEVKELLQSILAHLNVQKSGNH
ncbi:hypothetical protein BDZ97DRAFT_2073508 [Flammula alnicola]|nr:hypothetical protein BDZ97DRAFT_2073508 [Flammula alnicola]